MLLHGCGGQPSVVLVGESNPTTDIDSYATHVLVFMSSDPVLILFCPANYLGTHHNWSENCSLLLRCLFSSKNNIMMPLSRFTFSMEKKKGQVASAQVLCLKSVGRVCTAAYSILPLALQH